MVNIIPLQLNHQGTLNLCNRNTILLQKPFRMLLTNIFSGRVWGRRNLPLFIYNFMEYPYIRHVVWRNNSTIRSYSYINKSNKVPFFARVTSKETVIKSSTNKVIKVMIR